MSEAAAAPGGDNGGAVGATGNEAPAWAEGLSEDMVGYVQNKGWVDNDQVKMGSVFESYRNIEKMVGGNTNVVALPGHDASPEDYDKFYNSIGRPETPDGYGFEMPDTGDKELFGWFKDAAHRNGLTEAQAGKFLAEYQEMAEGRITAMEEQLTEQANADMKALEKEWGQGYQSQVQAGRIAAEGLGYDEDGLTNLENKLGTADFMKLMANIGSKMGEAGFVDGDDNGGAGFGLTPAQAKQQIADLKLDKNFMGAYLNGDKDAVAKMTRLNKFAYPGA